MMIVVMSPPAASIPAAPAYAPAKAPARTIPTVPTPAIIGIAAPTERVIAPIPPQTVGESRKCICVQSVRIYIPVPWIQTINYIPVKRAADTDGIAWIAETDNARGIFIIIFPNRQNRSPILHPGHRLLFRLYKAYHSLVKSHSL